MLGFFKTFAEKCAKVRQSITRSIVAVFSKPSLSADDRQSLERSLYEADFGVDTVEYVLKRVEEASKTNKNVDGTALLRQILIELLQGSEGNPLLVKSAAAAGALSGTSETVESKGYRENTSEGQVPCPSPFERQATNGASYSNTPFTSIDNSSSSDKNASLSQSPSKTQAIDLQVILLLGINGAGKTTTAAKLAHFFEKNNRHTLLGSCDTFRAAADQQLKTWAERLNLDCIGSQQRADAASVAYDVCQAGLHRGYQRVILDTAGRLHTKTSLTEELKKMVRVLHKCHPSFPQHRWLVIDGSLGTNSLQQAKLFHEAVGLTGLIVTKLDGTSKGGALVGIYQTLHVPIYFVGLGEKAEDFQPFSITSYVEALVGGEG
ncbi:MAG: signal recognition particle-docking protein FtsY [Opitutales bacterium]|nr:signal recognition particle-docking protein FtsY [Opitutales bacterium]